MTHFIRPTSASGSVLVIVLMSIAVLAMITAAALYRIGPSYASTYHSSSWNEALASAETGADHALVAMNNSMKSPETAWTAWTPSDATTFPKTLNISLAPHSGEGNTKVFATVRVDNSITDGSGRKWLRVRSTGVAELPVAARFGIESASRSTNGTKNHNNVLRKARFTSDLTGGALRLPQIARTIELMASPPGSRLFIRGLTVEKWMNFSGGAFTDSFDSHDPTKSTDGRYDLAKRQRNGDVASNSSGNISDFGNLYVNGTVSSNGGTISNTTHVTGSIYNNFQTDLPPVVAPVWTSMNTFPIKITNPGAPVTLYGGAEEAPQNYKLIDLTISNGNNPLILAAPVDGQDAYINIWVTGRTTVSGSGFIQQMPGVHVNIYGEQDITISGSGFLNQTYLAENLIVYGITPSSGTVPKLTVSGSADFIGVLDAPAFDITISGSAAFMGAAIGRNATISVDGGFHYDEALGNLGGDGATTYQFASWVEDVR